MTYRVCSSCGRQVIESCFDRATAHAPGCSVRRSILAKQNFQKRQARKERAKKAAETRALRRSGDAAAGGR